MLSLTFQIQFARQKTCICIRSLNCDLLILSFPGTAIAIWFVFFLYPENLNWELSGWGPQKYAQTAMWVAPHLQQGVAGQKWGF